MQKVSMLVLGPINGHGGKIDDIITELARLTIDGIAQTCFSGRANGLFLRQTYHPSTEKLRALVGFQPGLLSGTGSIGFL